MKSSWFKPICLYAVFVLAFGTGCSSGDEYSKQQTDSETQDAMIFPENYQTAYTLIRGCRPSTVHAGLGGITVSINSESLNAFTQLWKSPNSETPLPTGTVLVKEVYGDSADCSGSITEWAVMRKEKEGYASDSGNWNWQTVSADREVMNHESGVVDSCIACHRGVSVCAGYGQKAGYDYTCTEPLSTDPAF